MQNRIGNEVNYLGTTEMEMDYRECAHDWRCWAMLAAQVVPFGIMLIGGIYIIVKLAVIIHWQLDASLI